jgi:hypothetical protein
VHLQQQKKIQAASLQHILALARFLEHVVIFVSSCVVVCLFLFAGLAFVTLQPNSALFSLLLMKNTFCTSLKNVSFMK